MNKVELYPEQEEVLLQLKNYKSSLVIAETGSGKTIIALEKIENEYQKLSPKRVLVVAPTNILVLQHYRSFIKYENIPIFILKAGLKIIDLNKEGVYITTAHYAKIISKKLEKTHYDMIIYDEAHKGISLNSPYCFIANYFNPSFNYGFTASPGSSKNLKLLLKNLNFKNVVYGKAPKKYLKTLIISSIKNNPVATQTYTTYTNWLKTQFNNLYTVLNLPSQNILYYLLKNKTQISGTLSHNNMSLYYYYVFFHLYYCGYLYYYESYDTFYNYYKNTNKWKLDKYSMFNILKSKKYENNKFKKIFELCKNYEGISLVFFENYVTATSCKEFLIKQGFLKEEIEVLAGKDKMKIKERDLIIKKIHDNKIKIILATSVVEEGVDIKGVDQVIFYKPILNKIRIIQRSGRTGRHKDGVINIMYYLNSEEKIANV